MQEIKIYDTTLRDGSQGEGISFSVIDKIKIAKKLDKKAAKKAADDKEKKDAEMREREQFERLKRKYG